MATVRVLDRSIPAPAYLAGIRAAKATPDATFKQSLWHWTPDTGAEIIRQYRHDLHRRINERGGFIQLGPRVNPSTWGRIATPRVIIERCQFRSLNRHQRRHTAERVREE